MGSNCASVFYRRRHTSDVGYDPWPSPTSFDTNFWKEKGEMTMTLQFNAVFPNKD
jgi:hypothetical protein